MALKTRKSTPDVFIIESLRFEDEERGHAEGNFLAHIFRLAHRYHKYFYIRTKQEFEEVLDQFETSQYRYLHISCHAGPKGIDLTLDRMSIPELGAVLAPYVNKRRVFFSACELGNERLAAALLKDTGCYSVVAPAQAIGFDQAALFWASLYHLMFRNEKQVMKQAELTRNLAAASSLFNVRMRYFSSSKRAARGFREERMQSEIR